MRPRSLSLVLKTTQTGGFLVSNLTNIRYLTGVELSAGLLLIRPQASTLFVDGRYTEVASQSARKGISVRGIDALEKALSTVRECGFESENVTVNRVAIWKRKFPNTKFVRKRGVIEEFRRSKDDEELKLFRRAQSITKEIIARVPGLLRRSITERELAWKLREWAHELGADDLSFDPIVAFGTNTSRPHHRPGTRRLKKGHIVQIDVGAKYRGYCADRSEVFFTAKPTRDQKLVYETVLAAKEKAMAAVKAGVTNHALDRVARAVLASKGLEKYFVHSLGHGVGLDIHEGPTISSSGEKVALERGEIITIEPGVYLPGKFGILLEEEVIVI